MLEFEIIPSLTCDIVDDIIVILFQFGGPTTDSIPRVGGRFVHHFS